MKTNIFKTAQLLFFSVVLAACSNLDESAFHPVEQNGETIIFSETFESGLGDFVQYSDSGDQIWTYYSGGYATISGYVNSVNNANIDWLVSPEIDLSKVTEANLSFDLVARYFSDVTTEATVWVSEDFAEATKPSGATWTQLKTGVFADPGSWTFGNSGEISLTEFAGKKIYIAFKYISSATKAGTWELRNILVKKGEAVVDAQLIYQEPFASSLGSFTQVSVNGAQFWYITNGYAYMTGYVSPSNLANEDWLISPEIDLTEQTAANFSFDHVTRYFASLASEATVWISTDYVEGLPSTGTWTQIITSPFKDPGAWTFSNSQKISLTQWCGSKVRIAFKYISTASKAGSWEIKNFQVYSGEANGTDLYPYTVTQAIDAQTGGTGWVEGYVVGYAWPFIQQYAYYFGADTCSQISNIIISDSIFDIYSSFCIAVQLPRGSMRNQLNLMSNKSLYEQKIKVYGTLSSSLGIAGIINPTKYILPDGTTGTSSTSVIYTESFSSGLGNFTANSVKGTQAWRYQSGYGATMSGYQSTNYENEDWLISPEIDLTSYNGAALSFDHAINYTTSAKILTEQTLWVTSDDGITWKQLSIPTCPPGTNWTFVNSGEISIDAYAGQKIKIAFKYLSTTASAATWEVKNFQIYN